MLLMIYIMNRSTKTNFQSKCSFLNKIESLTKRKTNNKTYIGDMKYLLIKINHN
jgi:hypothetical protein